MKKLLLITIVLAFGCSQTDKKETELGLPYYVDSSFTPYWPGDADFNIDLDTAHQVGAFRFQNQNGDFVRHDDFEGKVFVANFFFTYCPSICPKMENNLSTIQDEFLENDLVKILSHSVMPWADSVSRLKEYAELNDINSSIWHLVTGERDDLYRMGRTQYFADEGFGKGLTDLDDFLHTENIVLVDGDRHIRGVYNGTLPLEMKRLISDINWLLRNS